MTSTHLTGDRASMPTVATSPADLLTVLSGSAHLDDDRLVIDDEAAFRGAAIADLAWTAAFSRTRPRPAAAQWLVWEASQALGARSASIQELYDARARGEVVGLHGPGDQPARPGVRHGPDDLRRGRGGRCRRGHPRARPQRADVHVPAPDRLRDVRPRRRDRGGLARPGLHPGRPLPVQRQEVRGRPRGDDRGDPARLPPRDRRGLPQHRHRLVDARRPLEAERRRGAARELPARGRADRAHPDARDGRRHGQRRRRDRRGRDPELDGRGAARLPRRLPPRARRARRRAPRGISKVSVQTGTSHGGVPLPDGGVAEVKLDFEVLRELGRRRPRVRPGRRRPARRVDPARRAVPPLPGGRDGRDPPRDRLPERALRAPGLPRSRCTARSRRGASPTRPTSARPARPTSSSSTRPARRRSGRSSASCGTSTTKDEILAAQRRKISYLFTELRVNDSRSMVDRYVQPVELHRPIPDALRGAVAAR